MTDHQPTDHDRCAAHIRDGQDYTVSHYTDTAPTTYEDGGTLPPHTNHEDTDTRP